MWNEPHPLYGWNLERNEMKEEDMEFDILNSKERKVLCVRNVQDGMMIGSHNHHLLEVGKEYTVENVEVNSWHTLVYLKEFPNKGFNSVVFNEIAEHLKGSAE